MFPNESEFNRLVGKLPIDTHVDPAHKQVVRQRMLEQFAQAHAAPARPQGPLGWMRSLSVKTKSLAALAAVLAITAGILAVIYYGGGAKIALADVQRKLNAVPAVSFRLEMIRPGATTIDAQTYVTEDSRLRMETPEVISIFDWQSGKTLTLFPQNRHAILGDVRNLNVNPYHRNWLNELRQIVADPNARQVGEKTIDGTKTIGWQVTDQDGWTTTVWADADTAELVRVECMVGQAGFVLGRFRYDATIDESLLEMTIPAGYVARSILIDHTKAAETDLLLLLRIWASGNGDVFPDALDPWKFNQAANKADWEEMDEYAGGRSSDEISQAIGQAFWWMNANPGWTYAGAGVKFGDAETAVFWYRTQGTGTWRVIYGDLHAETAEAPPK